MAFRTLDHISDSLPRRRADDLDLGPLPTDAFADMKAPVVALDERSVQPSTVGNDLRLSRTRPGRPAPISAIVVAAVALGGIVWISESHQPRGVVQGGAATTTPALVVDAPGTSPDLTGAPSDSPAPNFKDYGFLLAASQPVPRPQQGALKFTYEREDGTRVFLHRTDGTQRGTVVGPVFLQGAPVSLIVWRNGGRTYALVGEVNPEELLELAKIASDAESETVAVFRFDPLRESSTADSAARGTTSKGSSPIHSAGGSLSGR